MTVENLTENAKKILKERYLKRNEEGKIDETPEEMFRRIAHEIAEVNEKYDDDREVKEEEKEFFEALTNLDFIPNSPTLMNAGLELGQLSACFVLSPNDNMESIFQQVKNAAKIFQSGGGVGYTFSRLRPRGDTVKSTGGIASGPVSFMKVYDEMCNTIKQGGRRRGAQMGVLSVQHPDIEEFIEAKDEEGELENFNISVALTEEFMEAVRKGEDYDLINPRSDEVEGQLDAERIYDKIVNQAWKNGEPGILFLDRINEDNPFDMEEYPEHYIDATNPCVAEGTLVNTPQGCRKVENIEVGDEISTVLGHETVDSIEVHEDYEVYRVTFSDGGELKVTAQHQFHVKQEGKKVKPLPLTQIEVDDYVRLHPSYLKEKGDDGLYKRGLKRGILIGDGCYTEHAVNNNTVSISTNEDEDEYAKRIKELFGENLFRTDNEILDCKTKNLILANGRTIIENLNLEPSKSPDKSFSCSELKTEAEIMGVLDGLLASDGDINLASNHPQIRWTTSSKELAHSIRNALLSIGIHGRITVQNKESRGGTINGRKIKANNPKYTINVSGSSARRFAEKSRLEDIHPRKGEELLDLRRNWMTTGNTWKAQIESIEKLEDKTTVYDLYCKESDTWITEGYVQRGCGEQPLEDFEACNLGHINLSHAVNDGKVDWNHLEEMVDLSVRFLDNVIDASDFPNVTGYEGEGDAIRKKVNENRKIGLGVMGWHNMLMQLEIPYDSEEAIDKAHEVMEFIHNKSKEISKKIAEDRGKFPNWDESEYDEPIRNATTTTIAPTGTTSMIANTSGGIEPVFAVSYIKNVLDGETMVMPDPVFEDFAKERGFYSDELMENIAKQGSVTNIDEVPEDVKPLFKTALEISPEWHIRMQAAFQEHVDNAISKTVNFPNEATEEDIKEVYDLAYELGCKGVTVYRSGSRQEQVMEVEGEKEEEDEFERRPRERPTTVEGTTQKIETGYGSLYVTINQDEYGLFEVFSQIGRAGGFTQSFTESLARLISLCLRSGIPPEEIIDQLEGIRSPEIAFEEGEKILSIPDAMAKAIKWHKEGKKRTEQAQLPTEKESDKSAVEQMVSKGINPACPDCGAMLTLSEGCVTCPNCGYSQC